MDSFAQPEHTEGTISAIPGTSGAPPVRNRMVSCVHTVAFNGIDVLDIDCQVQLSSGMVAFNIVGLPDEAVAESRERARGAGRDGARFAAAADHRQSCARRCAERGLSFRPADRGNRVELLAVAVRDEPPLKTDSPA